MKASCDNPHTDFFQSLLYDKSGGSRDLPFKEMVQEATVMLNAGSNPMATTMVNTLYLLIKNPSTMTKLRAEVDPVLGSDVIASFKQIEGLKYLRACIDEAMRDRPSTSFGLPRKTPPQGATISGYQIPGGVTVSVPTYTLHHNPTIFTNPWEYKPERWLEGDTAAVKNYVIPFSVGARACIGRNIAYLEIMIVIATLVHRYEFGFETEGFVLESIERFNTNPGAMPVRVRLRDGLKA
jgi:cytochrome P450